MAKAEAYTQMVATALMAFDPKNAILKYLDEIGLTGVGETLSQTLGQLRQSQVGPSRRNLSTTVAPPNSPTRC
jgi:hypothetical protein